MNPMTYLTWTLVVFTLIMLVCAITPLEADQDEARGGISGKVVDLNGNPIPDFRFAIQRAHQKDGRTPPGPDFLLTMSKVRTDATGAFDVTGLHPGLVQLSPLPDSAEQPKTLLDAFKGFLGEEPPQLPGRSETGKRIHALQIGSVTLFNINIGSHPFAEDPFAEGLTFAIEPGVILENFTVIVKSRLRIRAQVVYPDGKPVANEQLRLNLEQRHETQPSRKGTSGHPVSTDAEGYFTYYVDEPGFYTVSVIHSNLSAGVGPFLLKDGVEPDEIVIKLAGKAAADVAGGIPLSGEVRFRRSAPSGVWIINPTNGHAYKRIQCQGWHDAQRQAVAAGAHLVSINDEVEQQWLGVIFRQKPFWIGLNDLEEEGEWRWDSGEPVTYTNWTVDPAFNDKLPDTEKDYVVLTFRGNGWQSVGRKGQFWHMARFAVIEKDGLVSTIIKE